MSAKREYHVMYTQSGDIVFEGYTTMLQAEKRADELALNGCGPITIATIHSVTERKVVAQRKTGAP